MFYFIFVSTAFYLLIISLLFTKLESKSIPYNLFILPLLIILSFIIGSREPGVDHDYLNYIDWIEEVGGSLSNAFIQGKDIGFIILFTLTSFFDDGFVLFFILVAFLSLFFKLKFSSLVFNGRYIPLVLFVIISRFLIIHDFTQIRAGLAIALASYGLLKSLNGNKTIGGVLIFVGIFIHLSATLLLISYLAYVFIHKRKFSRSLVLILPLAGIFMGEVLKLILPYLNSPRINVYLSGQYLTQQVSLLSFYYIVRFITFYGIMLCLYRKIDSSYRIYIFIASISLFLNSAFAWNDSIGLRLVEVLGFFDMTMLVLPMLYLEKNSKILYSTLLTAVSIIFFISSTKIVNDYVSYFF